MAKKLGKLSSMFVPIPGEIQQGSLFSNARTEIQDAILLAADGTRNIGAIAASCGISRTDCEKFISPLIEVGELREASIDEMHSAAEKLPAVGRFEDAIQIYQRLLVLRKDDNAARLELASLYETTARPREAATAYGRLSVSFKKAGQLGDALVAARKAADLQAGNWKLQNALAELCIMTGRIDEAARTWRSYARRLAGVGHYKQALKIIDDAVEKIPGSDILLLSEAEILSSMEHEGEKPPVISVAPPSVIEKKNNLVRGSNSKDIDLKTNRRTSRTLSYGWYIAAGMVLLALMLAAYDFQAREQMRSAARRASIILAESAEDSLKNRVAAGKVALETLNEAEPILGFVRNEEYLTQLGRVEIFLRSATESYAEEQNRQKGVIILWQEKQIPERLVELERLASLEEIGNENVEKAKSLIKEWQAQKLAENNELRTLLDTLKNKGMSVEARFKAYKTISAKFPLALTKEYPLGSKDLTLPVDIKASSAGYTARIDFSVFAYGELLRVGEELPLDPEAQIRVEFPGFSTKDNKDYLIIKSPLSREIEIELAREPLWQRNFNLPFLPQKIKLDEGSKTAVLAARSEVAVLTLDDEGGIVYKKHINWPERSISPDNFDLFIDEKENHAAIMNNGAIYFFETASDKGWFASPAVGTLGVMFANNEMSNNQRTAIVSCGYMGGNNSPLYAYEAKGGKLLWPGVEGSARLQVSMSRPVSKPYKLGWDILVLGRDATLSVVLMNGEFKDKIKIPGLDEIKGESAFYESDKRNTCLLFTEGTMYEVEYIRNEYSIKRLWNVALTEAEHFISDDNNIYIYDDKLITSYRKVDGALKGEFKFPQPITTAPVSTGRSLLLPMTGKEEKSGLLLALQLYAGADYFKPYWNIKMKSTVTALGHNEQSFLVSCENGEIIFFDK